MVAALRAGWGPKGQRWVPQTPCRRGGTILLYDILYYTILYYTILYYTILYYTILYYAIVHQTPCLRGGKTWLGCAFLAVHRPQHADMPVSVDYYNNSSNTNE